jgi:hypothetical protein
MGLWEGNGVVLSDGTLALLFGELKDHEEAKSAYSNQRFGQQECSAEIPPKFIGSLKIVRNTLSESDSVVGCW